MRGKHGFGDVWVRIPRITPAGAGKTALSHLQLAFSKDHPRRCGENRDRLCPTCNWRGSPPQVRGKPVGTLLAWVKAQDHPRRCGENSEPAGKTIVNVGSPPQVRGKPLSASTHHRVYRITPAGAGKTQVKYVHPLHLADHPRRCGENKHLFFRHVGSVGSPPQVRGKQWRNKKMTSIERITPAGAGKTCTSHALGTQ